MMIKKIWDNINLTIKKRDKIIVTGQSGSGKSTLIKIILGFLKPLKGNIRIDNDESLQKFYSLLKL